MAIDLRPQATPLTGQVRFIRYAFMPNQLRFCGGDDNRTIFQYGIEQYVDDGLRPLLTKFTGALPYLQLIARANGIADPFDDRVVEAYWLGSDLLNHVEVRQLYDHLLERFGPQLQGRARHWILSKAPAGARPHHNFHVFDIHSKVGQLEHSLHTLDNCRVSWGKVVNVEGPELVVERSPLMIIEGKLTLGPPALMRAIRQIEARGFADAAAVGDWVSLHWGWVCEVITPPQQANLVRFTDHQLRIANQTV